MNAVAQQAYPKVSTAARPHDHATDGRFVQNGSNCWTPETARLADGTGACRDGSFEDVLRLVVRASARLTADGLTAMASAAVTADILEFDEAVGVALDFAARTPGTLVVVTSDHETGGFSLVEELSRSSTTAPGRPGLPALAAVLLALIARLSVLGPARWALCLSPLKLSSRALSRQGDESSND